MSSAAAVLYGNGLSDTENIYSIFIISDCAILSSGFLMFFQKNLQNFLFSPQNSGEKFLTDVTKETSAALLLHHFYGNSSKALIAATPDSSGAELLAHEVTELLKLANISDRKIYLLPEPGRGKMIFSGTESTYRDGDIRGTTLLDVGRSTSALIL